MYVYVYYFLSIYFVFELRSHILRGALSHQSFRVINCVAKNLQRKFLLINLNELNYKICFTMTGRQTDDRRSGNPPRLHFSRQHLQQQTPEVAVSVAVAVSTTTAALL